MGDERSSPKLSWVTPLPSGPPDKQALARRVELGDDEFETDLYEGFADPVYVQIERDRRRYRGQFLRRIRHRPT